MPEILLWRQTGAEKSIDTLKQEERNKLFTHTIVKQHVSHEDGVEILIEEEDKLEKDILPSTGEEHVSDALSKLVAGEIETTPA